MPRKIILAPQRLPQRPSQRQLRSVSQNFKVMTTPCCSRFYQLLAWSLLITKTIYNWSDFMIYGYARISSKTQLNGNSLDDQSNTLTLNGANIIISEQYTGKTTSRPKLQNLLVSLQPGDTLMVTKLDRLARNVTEGIELIKTLLRKTSEFMFLILA